MSPPCAYLISPFMSSVHPVAPVQFSVVTYAWSATVLWQWENEGYASLPLACQVELTSMGIKTKVCCDYSEPVNKKFPCLAVVKSFTPVDTSCVFIIIIFFTNSKFFIKFFKVIFRFCAIPRVIKMQLQTLLKLQTAVH